MGGGGEGEGEGVIQLFNAKFLPNFYFFSFTKETNVKYILTTLEKITLKMFCNLFSKLRN